MFFVFLFLFLVSSYLPISGKVAAKPRNELYNEELEPEILDQFVNANQTFVNEEKARSGKVQSRILLEENGKVSNELTRKIRSETNSTGSGKENLFASMDTDDLTSGFGMKMNGDQSRISRGGGGGTSDESIIGTPSDYVLIAMIIAMMFSMTLCCLCLFCRSSSRLTICGINFEMNDRRNSMAAAEDLSEIHEVVPLTPTTAGADSNRLPDIESILRADAPPPLYSDIVRKHSQKQKLQRKTAVSLQDEIKRTATSEQQAKIEEARIQTKLSKKKSSTAATDRGSQSSSVTPPNGGRSSWKISGRGILASFRAKSSMLRSRKSDNRQNVEEGALTQPPSYPGNEDRTRQGDQTDNASDNNKNNESGDTLTMETVNKVVKEADDSKPNKVFVYDVSELPDDDDVFL